MKETLKKQHYKFTLYRLDTYYNSYKPVKRYWDDSVYYEHTTWINHSNYSEAFSVEFSDEKKLKAFLKERYKNDNSVSFYTNLGIAIKSCNLHNSHDWISIVSTATSEERICFQLKPRKKRNKFPQKRKSRYHDYYASSYDWLAKEIKRKHIDKFVNEINAL